MVTYCSKHLALEQKFIVSMRYTNTTLNCRGKCYYNRRHIIVRTKPRDYVSEWRPRRGQLIRIEDRWECIVFLTTHELAHLYLAVHKKRMGRGEERWCDHQGITLTEQFREEKGVLVPQWEREHAKVS